MPLGHPMNNVNVEWTDKEWFWQAKVFTIEAYCIRNGLKLNWFADYGLLRKTVSYQLSGDRERAKWLLERLGKEHLLAPVV